VRAAPEQKLPAPLLFKLDFSATDSKEASYAVLPDGVDAIERRAN
jgi:hypothetical protein